MDKPISVSERRQIENEMIFRRVNEKVGTGLDDLDKMHIEDGNPQLVRDDEEQLHFKCECSDENCEARIQIRLSIYRKVHLNRDSFIVKLNHQVEPIEKVVVAESEFSVVKKNNSTPEPGDDLNVTTIDNS